MQMQLPILSINSDSFTKEVPSPVTSKYFEQVGTLDQSKLLNKGILIWYHLIILSLP